jgi:hypothetical protein
MLFTLVSGQYVHPASTATEQLVYAATQQARPIESVAPWIGRDVAALVNRALAFDRAARWPDARSMQTALRAARGLTGARPTAPPGHPALAQTVDARDMDTLNPGPSARRSGVTGTVSLDEPPSRARKG